MKAVACGLLCLSIMLAAAPFAPACTGIRIRAQDGSIIYARTLEFGIDLESSVLVIPRQHALQGTAPGGLPGVAWTGRHGVVGANAFGLVAIVDGLNEHGLAVGTFYFPGYAQYQAVDAAQAAESLAPWELPAYLLTTAATVDEAVAACGKVRVGAVVQKNFGFVPPCHYVVHDASGRCAVLEYVGGELIVHDNPLGVMSNAPTFDWHLTNLRNYASLGVANVPPVELTGVKLSGFGQGNGLFGLPGDFTPPSRFVRAVAFAQSAVPSATAREGVLTAFHILNQFDIPKGAVRSVDRGQTHDDYTLWTSTADLANKRFYFRTYANSRIRCVELGQQDLDARDVRTIPMTGAEEFQALTGSAH